MENFLRFNLYFSLIIGHYYVLKINDYKFGFQIKRGFFLLIPIYAVVLIQIVWKTQMVTLLLENTNLLLTEIPVQNQTETSYSLEWKEIAVIFYAFVCVLLFIKFIFNVFKVSQIIKKSQKINGIYVNNQINQAFTFLNFIVIPSHQAQNQWIIKHENLHRKQLHSLDILWYEVLKIVLWFNPFMYLGRKLVEENLEYWVDNQIQTKENLKSYQYSLIGLQENSDFENLVGNHFNKSLIKKRIKMMNKKQNSGIKSVLLSAIIMTVTGLSYFVNAQKVITKEMESSSKNDTLLKSKSEEKNNLIKGTITQDDTFLEPQKISKNSLLEKYKETIKDFPNFTAIYLNDKKISIEDLKKEDIGNSFGYSEINENKENIVHFYTYSYANENNIKQEDFIKTKPEINLNKHNPNTYKTESYTIKRAFNNPTSNQDNAQYSTTVTAVIPTFESKDVDEKAEYKEGMDELMNFIGQNLTYPKAAVDAKIEGRVILKFIVNEDGTLSDIKTTQKLGGGCDEEVIRVIKMTNGKWNPAKKEKRAIKSYFQLPIAFRLPNK